MFWPNPYLNLNSREVALHKGWELCQTCDFASNGLLQNQNSFTDYIK